MKYWQEFQQFDYANEFLIGIGIVCILLGILQIVRSSIKMLFWLVIASVGIFATTYGMKQGSYSIPGLDKLFGPSHVNAIASSIDPDVLDFLCQKIDTKNECTPD